jgi:chemotaxis protein methyltransferase CheR
MAATIIKIGVEGLIQLRDEEFSLISGLVYERFGINLTDKKKALVRGRLNSLVKSQGFSSFEEYYASVVNDPTGGSLLSLIDRISTNHSYFFRETEHFEILTSKVLPEIMKKVQQQGSRELRLWCAGCAAGEEAYTLAMVLAEYFGSEAYRLDIRILATDISVSALQQAVEGAYSAHKLKFVPEQYRKYFKKLDDDNYQVVESIKRMVLFKRLNLMREDFPFKKKFHTIFCRNVMIYFDQITRRGLIEKFQRYIYQDGYLFIGHSESLGRETGMFRYIQPTVYKR